MSNTITRIQKIQRKEKLLASLIWAVNINGIKKSFASKSIGVTYRTYARWQSGYVLPQDHIESRIRTFIDEMYGELDIDTINEATYRTSARFKNKG